MCQTKYYKVHLPAQPLCYSFDQICLSLTLNALYTLRELAHSLEGITDEELHRLTSAGTQDSS
jgi:hypothetical protein